MIESAAGTSGDRSAEKYATTAWLKKWKEARGERPRNKAYGRWLGDFVNQLTDSGLHQRELQLLVDCALGPRKLKELSAPLEKLTWDKGKAEALKNAVQPYLVRATFLRFLALGGDEFAPVHESGIELHNAFVDSTIDLRGAKCVGRLAIIDCYVNGALWIEDASLGILFLQRSRVAGIRANRAKLSGSAFLENSFVDWGEVNFLGAEIGGSLQCGGAKIRPKNGQNGLICTGAKIGGNVSLNAGFECEGRVFFLTCRGLGATWTVAAASLVA